MHAQCDIGIYIIILLWSSCILIVSHPPAIKTRRSAIGSEVLPHRACEEDAGQVSITIIMIV